MGRRRCAERRKRRKSTASFVAARRSSGWVVLLLLRVRGAFRRSARLGPGPRPFPPLPSLPLLSPDLFSLLFPSPRFRSPFISFPDLLSGLFLSRFLLLVVFFFCSPGFPGLAGCFEIQISNFSQPKGVSELCGAALAEEKAVQISPSSLFS